MAEEPTPTGPPPSPGDDFYARDRAFWLTMGRAAIIGLIAGAGALAFTQLVRIGTNVLWPDEQTRREASRPQSASNTRSPRAPQPTGWRMIVFIFSGATREGSLR